MKSLALSISAQTRLMIFALIGSIPISSFSSPLSYSYGLMEGNGGPHAVISTSRSVPGNLIESSTFTYDLNGNPIEKRICKSGNGFPPCSSTSVTSYQYDSLEHLKIENANGIQTKHFYDALGNKIATHLSDGKVYTYIGSARVVSQNSIRPTPRALISYESGELSEEDHPTTHQPYIRFMLTDQLGSVVAIAANRQIQSIKEYLPYGQNWAQKNADGNPSEVTDYDFTGMNVEGNLLNFNARHMGKGEGRLLQGDTVTPEGNGVIELNRYTYAYNNPINLVDPSGHAPLPSFKGVRGSLGGVYQRFRSWIMEEGLVRPVRNKHYVSVANMFKGTTKNFERSDRERYGITLRNQGHIGIGLFGTFQSPMGPATMQLSLRGDHQMLVRNQLEIVVDRSSFDVGIEGGGNIGIVIHRYVEEDEFLPLSELTSTTVSGGTERSILNSVDMLTAEIEFFLGRYGTDDFWNGCRPVDYNLLPKMPSLGGRLTLFDNNVVPVQVRNQFFGGLKGYGYRWLELKDRPGKEESGGRMIFDLKNGKSH